MLEFRTCQTKPSFLSFYVLFQETITGDKPNQARDPSIILGLALNPPGEDECVAYYDFRGNEILWPIYNLFNNPPSCLFLCNFEAIPSKSSMKQCMWKPEDFIIKLFGKRGR